MFLYKQKNRISQLAVGVVWDVKDNQSPHTTFHNEHTLHPHINILTPLTSHTMRSNE